MTLNTEKRINNIVRAGVGAEARTGADAQEAAHHKRVADRFHADTKHMSPHEIMARARGVKIDEAAARENINQNIGTVDSKGAVTRTADETIRYTDVSNAEEVARNIIQKDFTSLTIAEKDVMRKGAHDALKEIPETKPLLDEYAGDPAALDAFIMGTLGNLDDSGDLKASYAKQYNEVFGRERVVSQKTIEAQAKVDEAKAKVDAIDESIKANNAASAETNKKLNEFAAPIVGGVPVPGPKAFELMAEEGKVSAYLAGVGKGGADIAAMRASKSTNELKLQNLKDKYTAIMEKPVGGPGTTYNAAAKAAELKGVQDQIDTASGVLEEAELILPEYDRVATKRDALAAEETGLKAEVNRQYQEDLRLKTERVAAAVEHATLNGDLDTAKLEEADKYVKDAQGIMKDAVKKLYEQRILKAAGLEEEAYQKMIDDEVNPAAKKVLEQARDGRWRKIEDSKLSKIPKLRRGKNLGHGEVERFDKKRIESDINIVKTHGEKGPEEIVKNMLQNEKNHAIDPVTGSLMYDAQGKPVMERVYTDDQIDNMLQTPKFKDQVIPAVRNKLLATALKAGVLSERDSEMVQNVLGADAISTAMEAHKEWFEQKKKEAGFAGKTIDFIKKHPKFGWWLAISIFYPPAGLLLGGAFATKELFAKKNEHATDDHKEDHKTEPTSLSERTTPPPVGTATAPAATLAPAA